MTLPEDGGDWSPTFGIIDFEASSLDENSFPIEVGVAIVRAWEIESWASLIRPTREWLKRDAWSRRSQAVHGLSLDALSTAPIAADIVAELNRKADGFAVLHCDGGSYDAHWLSELCAASGLKATFALADLAALISMRPALRERYATLMRASAMPNRAEADARKIAEVIVRLLRT